MRMLIIKVFPLSDVRLKCPRGTKLISRKISLSGLDSVQNAYRNICFSKS
jgi:hypothetical protein